MAGFATIPAAEATASVADTEMQTLERQARTGLYQAQTQEAKIKVAREQQMLQIMAKGPQTGEDGKTLSEAMLSRATDLFHAGFVNEALAIYTKVDEAKARDSNAASNALRARLELIGKKDKELDDMNNFFAGAVDEGSFNILKQMWVSEHPDMPLPPQFDRFDPKGMEALRNSTKGGRELLGKQLTEARNEETKQYHAAEISLREHSEKALDAYRAWSKNFQEQKWRERKAGGPKLGKVAARAGNEDIERAQQLIGQDFPEIDLDMPLGGMVKDAKGNSVPKEVISAAAYDIANQAQVLRTQNPALSIDQAMAQVYKDMKDRGVFKSWTKKEDRYNIGGFGFGGKKETKSTKYDPGIGTSPKDPAPMPPRGKPPVDGNWYDIAGKAMKWDAKKGKFVGAD